MSATRGAFNSNLGFVLAAIGSAVGLGNLWGFAYSASQGGGAAFLVLYLVFVAVLGLPILTVELAIGRHTRQSAIGAMREVGGRHFAWLGWMFFASGFVVLSFYSVIMGWTGRLLVDFARGAVPLETGAHFAAISEGGGAVTAHLAGMLLTVWIVARGVNAGIERVARLLMPVLGVLIVGLALWAATLSGGGPGYEFYLKPDLEALLRPATINWAASQAFFSLSLGMGAVITYASYLADSGSLPGKAITIALADTGIAVIGGLITFPIIYHFGLQSQVDASPVGGAVHRGATWAAGSRRRGPADRHRLLRGPLHRRRHLGHLHARSGRGAARGQLWLVAPPRSVDGRGRHRSSRPAGRALQRLGGLPFAVFGQVVLIFGGLMLAVTAGYVWSAADSELARGFPHPGARRAWLWLLRTLVPAALLIVLFLSIGQSALPAWRALVGGG